MDVCGPFYGGSVFVVVLFLAAESKVVANNQKKSSSFLSIKANPNPKPQAK